MRYLVCVSLTRDRGSMREVPFLFGIVSLLNFTDQSLVIYSGYPGSCGKESIVRIGLQLIPCPGWPTDHWVGIRLNPGAGPRPSIAAYDDGLLKSTGATQSALTERNNCTMTSTWQKDTSPRKSESGSARYTWQLHQNSSRMARATRPLHNLPVTTASMANLLDQAYMHIRALRIKDQDDQLCFLETHAPHGVTIAMQRVVRILQRLGV